MPWTRLLRTHADLSILDAAFAAEGMCPLLTPTPNIKDSWAIVGRAWSWGQGTWDRVLAQPLRNQLGDLGTKSLISFLSRRKRVGLTDLTFPLYFRYLYLSS